MKNKNAIITGGSSGIGKAITLSVAQKGYNIIFTHYDKNDDFVNETLNLAKSFGTEIYAFKANSGEASEREKLYNFIFSKLGRIDLLVNNAGIAPPKRADILEATEESYDLVMNINLKGPYFITQKIANNMIEQVKKDAEFKPIIINTSSVSAWTSSTGRGEYCLSKAGVSMMTKLYADRLGEFSINVYEIQPGIIKTNMTSTVIEKYDNLIFNEGILLQKRWGFPEDVAKVVESIIDGHFSYSTGQVFYVDGGFQVRRL
jgi:NAD(P)-dependent dehydrogenase (short-subunit alcohol dehydrogenase family)